MVNMRRNFRIIAASPGSKKSILENLPFKKRFSSCPVAVTVSEIRPLRPLESRPLSSLDLNDLNNNKFDGDAEDDDILKLNVSGKRKQSAISSQEKSEFIVKKPKF
jgi:hypothetical protein